MNMLDSVRGQWRMPESLSFEECVFVGCVAEGSIVLDEDGLAQVEKKLRSSNMLRGVADYASSSDGVLSSRGCGIGSVRAFAGRVKGFYKSGVFDESFSRYVGYDDFRVFVELLERVDDSLVKDDVEREELSKALGMEPDFLEVLRNSNKPLEMFRGSGLGFDLDLAVLSHLFFNKNLSKSDVVFLVRNLPFDVAADHGFGMHHFSLFSAVLLREDWSVAELRILWDEWCRFLAEFEERGFASFLGAFSKQVFTVELLFALNEAMSADLLWKVFDSGHLSVLYLRDQVRVAVMRNPGFDADFLRALLSNDVELVRELCGSSLLNFGYEGFSMLREAAVWNPVWSFEELLKVFEDESEAAEIRFAALFNENVPSFYRALHSD